MVVFDLSQIIWHWFNLFRWDIDIIKFHWIWWIISYHELCGAHRYIYKVVKFILSKLGHPSIGKNSGLQLGVKRHSMIIPQVFISVHWPEKMKLLKNSMYQIEHNILTIWLIIHLSPSNYQYQRIEELLKHVRKVKYNCRNSDASLLASRSCKNNLSDIILLFTDTEWSDNWYCKSPVPSISSFFLA